jgi:hypothetical protein
MIATISGHTTSRIGREETLHSSSLNYRQMIGYIVCSCGWEHRVESSEQQNRILILEHLITALGAE